MLLHTAILADWYLSQAYNDLATGDYDTAKTKIEAAIKLDPSSKAYNTLGICFGMANDLENAFACFTKSIKMNPDQTEAKVNRNSILERIEKRKRLYELEGGQVLGVHEIVTEVIYNLLKEDSNNG